jgi:hypothetical protein
LADTTVLWGKLLSDYAIWRTPNLPSPSVEVEANLEKDQGLIDEVTEGLYAQFAGSSHTFGTIFPFLFRLEDFGQLVLPVPVKNALGRNGIGSISDLLAMTPDEFGRFSSVGRTIIAGLFKSCLKASLLSTHTIPTVVPEVVTESLEIEPDVQLIGELKKQALLTRPEEQFFASWNSVGKQNLNHVFRQAFICHFLGQAQDSFVTFSNPALDSLGSDFDSSEESPFTVAELLNGFEIPTYKDLLDFYIDSLDQKEKEVGTQRLFATNSPSLDAVGVSLGVTRERIRQIEFKAISKYKNLKLNNPVFSAAVEALRIMVAEPIQISALSMRQKQLDASAGKGLGSILEVFASLEKLSIVDSWVYADYGKQQESFTQVMSELRNSTPLPSLREILDVTRALWPSFTAKTLKEWLLANSWQEFSGSFVPAKGLNQIDWAKLVLGIEKKPMTPESIVAKMPGEVSIKSFTNRLLEEPSITRTGISTYGLQEWGLEEFKSIHENLLDRVNEFGSVSLDSVIRKFTEDFGASKNSVIQYAKVWPLTIINGEVRKSLVKEENAPTRKSAYKNVYKTSDGYLWRTTVTGEHLRGSGSSFPSGLAFALGIKQGAKKVFESDFGSIPVSFVGLMTTIGSLRNICQDLAAGKGDQLSLHFSKGRVTARKVNLALTGEALVRELAGLPETGDIRGCLAFALDASDDASLDDLKEVLAKRRDTDLAEVLPGSS